MLRLGVRGLPISLDLFNIDRALKLRTTGIVGNNPGKRILVDCESNFGKTDKS